jgi:hypothetical protein
MKSNVSPICGILTLSKVIEKLTLSNFPKVLTLSKVNGLSVSKS